MNRSITGLMILFCWTVAPPLHASENDHHEHRNHLAFIAAYAEEEQKEGGRKSGYVLGFDYVRQIRDRWGLGLTFERETFGDNQKRYGILAFPLSFYPGGNWRLFGAPGMEFSEPWEAEKAIFRLGASYEFHIGERFTIAPEAQVDFVEGGTNVYVFGFAFGIGF